MNKLEATKFVGVGFVLGGILQMPLLLSVHSRLGVALQCGAILAGLLMVFWPGRKTKKGIYD